jgi:hypothetical protein
MNNPLYKDDIEYDRHKKRVVTEKTEEEEKVESDPSNDTAESVSGMYEKLVANK